MIDSNIDDFTDVFSLNKEFDVLKISEKSEFSDDYLIDLQLYQHNIPHAKHVPFPKEHKFKCEECGCKVLNYDSYLGEYSCARCGLVVESVVFTEIRNDQNTKKSHGILDETSETTKTNFTPKETDFGWGGYVWLEQMETNSRTGKIPTSGPLVNANPYMENKTFPNTTKDVCNVLNHRTAYTSQKGSTRWRGYNYQKLKNKLDIASKTMEKIGLKMETYPQIAKRVLYILKNYKLTQIHSKKPQSIVITGIVYYVIQEFFNTWNPPLCRRSGTLGECSKREYCVIKSNMNKLKSKNKSWRYQGLEYL